jgi:hypothetical protein
MIVWLALSFASKPELEEIMNREPEEYRFARIEGYRITLAGLENPFRDKAVKLEEMEAVAAEYLWK